MSASNWDTLDRVQQNTRYRRTVRIAAHKARNHQFAVVISFPLEFLESAGIILGDRVDLKVGRISTGAFGRLLVAGNPTGQYQIVPHSSSKSSAEIHIGGTRLGVKEKHSVEAVPHRLTEDGLEVTMTEWLVADIVNRYKELKGENE